MNGIGETAVCDHSGEVCGNGKPTFSNTFSAMCIGIPHKIATGGRDKIYPESAATKPGGHVWSLLQAHRPDIFYIFFDGFLAIHKVFCPENTVNLP